MATKTKRTPVILPAGPTRAVHVLAKALRENLENGTDKPMVGVRDLDRPAEVALYYAVCIQGPSVLRPVKDPLPGTDGRAICYLETAAELHCHEG